VRAVHEEQGIRIEIVDSGKGISPSEIDRVFEPHFTSKGKRIGLGLGLPICRQVVLLHNGDISLERNADRGTTVVITLPFA
jgi:signal transduction histidine kinase